MALFAWQIEKYLSVSYDSKVQGQIASMKLMIEAENIDAFDVNKFAYLHSDKDVADPLLIEEDNVDFTPVSTLNNLFVRNYFTPKAGRSGFCYWYLYFPPGLASETFEFYDDRSPAYILAGWGEATKTPIIASTLGLNDWASDFFKEHHFKCNHKNLTPAQLATDSNGLPFDLPGLNFQFTDFKFSQVKR